MHTFDTCDTCGLYYVTQDRSILPDHDKAYIPDEWSSVETRWQGVASKEGDIRSFGQCYVCDEVKDLRHRFTA